MRRVVCVVVIENNKILLVRKKDVWILPGGKPEAGESDENCLFREVSEELPEFTVSNLRYYDVFEGEAPHKKYKFKAYTYLADGAGGDAPASEINESSWTSELSSYDLSDVTQKVISSLQKDGYL